MLFPLLLIGLSPTVDPSATEIALERGRGELVVHIQDAERPDTLRLVPHSTRADGFRLRAWHEDGGLREVDPRPAATWVGSSDLDPNAVVVASLRGERLTARIIAQDGSSWTLTPEAASGGTGAGYRFGFEEAEPALACGNDAMQAMVVSGSGTSLATAGPVDVIPTDCLRRAEIAFDADFEYFQRKNSSVDDTLDAIELILLTVNTFYARDVQIDHVLTEVVVRTAPFYTPTSGGDLLNQFRSEWNTNMAGVPRDITHLMTSKPGSVIQFGGLAFVGVVCTSSQFGWSMDGANIVGHEVGHNWGSGHCHDSSPCNNMCGACFLVGPNTKRIIEAHRDSRACLEDAPPWPRRLPPYAYPEGIVLSKAELEALPDATFDVLGNDDDGNCDALRILTFDATSVRGGTITRSVGSGPRGRDQLVYTPPVNLFAGIDTFTYTVGDVQGKSAVGVVSIDSRPLDAAMVLTLDETTGDLAADATGNGHDSTTDQPAVWTPGVIGGGLDFDGTTQTLRNSSGDFDPPWTVGVWVRRRPGLDTAAGLIDSDDGGLRLEQHPNTGLVGVTKNGVIDAVFGYSAPIDQWVHLTFVGLANQTSLYVDGAFHSTLGLGIRGPLGPVSRIPDRMNGTLDDLRVFGYALTPGEIADLVANGGKAVAPRPRDGARLSSPSGTLSWLASTGAVSHDVYLGTSYPAVRNAGLASPEYLGRFNASQLAPGGLAQGTEYFWRVDEVLSGGATVEGSVWGFTPARSLHWPLDETGGDVAGETQEGSDGSYRNGVTLNQPGATTMTGSSVRLDGSDDFVRLPALNLNTNRATFGAWIRRNGSQSSFAGLIFSRAQSSTAGLNFGDANELRYHWNGASNTWGWDSGLVVPDDTWVFVALVVEPNQATIYMGQEGGALTSAVNSVGHSAEEFDGVIRVGSDNTGGARFFRGLVDDVQIFDEALSPAEVQELFALAQ